MFAIRTFRCLGWCLLSLFVQSRACYAQPDAKQDSQREIAKALRVKMEVAVKDRTTLHGCWADVSISEKGGIVVGILTDENKEIEQRHLAEVTSFAKTFVANQPERLTVEVKVTTRLPFSRFIKALQYELETDADSAGSKIQSGYFIRNSTDDELAIELLGEVTTTEKRERVLELANQSFQRFFAESGERVKAIRTDQVKVLVDSGRIDAITTRLRTEFQRIVREDIMLQGCWVDVNKSRTGELEIKALVDSTPEIETKQIRLIEAFVAQHSGRLPSRVSISERLPFSEFVKALKQEVEFNPEYHGAWVDRVYLNPPNQVEDQLDVILVGQFVDSDKRESVLKLANDLTAKFFSSLTDRVTAAKTTADDGLPAMELRVGSSARASHCRQRGVDAYVQRDYFAAYTFFTEASLQESTAIDLKYWRIVALIGQGRDDLAFPLVRYLVTARNQVSSKDPAILIPFENVQGRIRHRLIAMETQVFCRCSDSSCKCK